MTLPNDRYSEQVGQTATVVQEFAEAGKYSSNRDQKLRDAVDMLLSEIGADALVFCPDQDGKAFSVFKYYLEHEIADAKRKKAIIKACKTLAASSGSRGYFCHMDPGIQAEILFCSPNFPETSDAGSGRCRYYFAFLKMKNSSHSFGTLRWKEITQLPPDAAGFSDERLEFLETCCRALQTAFLRRAESEQVFPPRLNRRIWELKDIERPWHRAEPTGMTATLSFDIRKSTFAMESVIDAGVYARWIDGLVQLLRRIVHHYDGAFDKFTGDGVLAHFPELSVVRSKLEGPPEAQMAELALTCACDMIMAFEEYSRYLVPYLTVTRDDFGAGVGLALDKASWSVDSMGAPIVVGRGVVHACRASDSSPAGSIQCTNAFRHAIPQPIRRGHEWEKVEFVSKEFTRGSAVRIERMICGSQRRLGRPRKTMRELCKKVWDGTRPDRPDTP